MSSRIPPDRLERILRLSYDYEGQPKDPVRSCNLCGGERLVHLTHTDRYGYPARASACARCGLTFLNPVMTRAASSEFYAHMYRPLVSAYHNREINALTIQAEQATYARALESLLEPWLGRGNATRLLDIGGSTGVVARELAARFRLQATVLDPAAAELDWATRFGIETIAGFLEDYTPAGRHYDLVTLCQTLDHLTDAAGSLAKVRALLQPEGIFFLDIVDFRAAYLRHGSVEEAIKIDHPFSFTEDTAEALLKRAGFEVLQTDYAADHLHVGYVCAPTRPVPEALPDSSAVREFFREIRDVQNARR